jgi:hypothetical protein
MSGLNRWVAPVFKNENRGQASAVNVSMMLTRIITAGWCPEKLVDYRISVIPLLLLITDNPIISSVYR